MSNRSATHLWDVAAAEKEYISNSNISYADIAARHEVSVSAVKRYAALREWPKRRQNATEDGLEQHQENVKERIATLNEEHCLLARNIITVGNGLLLRLDQRLKAGKDIEARQLLSLASALHKAIMLERTIVGLPIHIIKNEAPPDPPPRRMSAEEAEATIERYIRHKKRIEEHTHGIPVKAPPQSSLK